MEDELKKHQDMESKYEEMKEKQVSSEDRTNEQDLKIQAFSKQIEKMISEKTDLSQNLKEMEFKLNEQIEINAELERGHKSKLEELTDANSLLTAQLQ